MAEILAAYLRRVLQTPFALGRHDCGTYLADWVLTARGIDPAARVRGSYANEAELAAVMGRRGLPGFVAGLAKEAGLKRTRKPGPGAIGVVCTDHGAPVCAIFTGRRWVARDHHRIVAVRPCSVRVLCAFEV